MADFLSKAAVVCLLLLSPNTFASDLTVFCMCIKQNLNQVSHKLLRYEINNTTGKIVSEKNLGLHPDLMSCYEAAEKTAECKR